MKLADVVFAATLMNMLSSQASSSGATCESLVSLSLRDTTITVAQTVAAGALRLPTTLPDPGPHGVITFVAAKDLPEFCRVVGVAKPSKDSEIKFEVWLPTSNWNGNFIGLGNGGMGGSISYGNMSGPLSGGHATASTDTGHESSGQDGSYALGHREKAILRPVAKVLLLVNGTNYLDTVSAFIEGFLHLLAGEGVWGRGRHLSPFPQ
jgi:feruloyl esterase